MNIGIFTDTYTPQINGVVVSIETLIKGLRSEGHNVYVFTARDPKLKDIVIDVHDEEYAYRLPSIAVPFSPEHRLALTLSRRLYKKIKELKLDVIHTQTEFTLGILGGMIGKKLNIPVIHTYHTMWADYAHYITRSNNDKINMPVSVLIQKISKTFCNKVKAVIAPSDKTKNALLSYGVNKPIMIIPTGINLEPFREEITQKELASLREEVGLKPSDKVVLFIGRIAAEKSIDIILKQFNAVVSKTPKAKLLLIGDGPARKDLENLTHKLDLTDHVIFAGKKPYEMIAKFYKLGDVFVNASTSETQGLTFVEAMASGIPVVAKYDKNLTGVITDRVSGSLFTNEQDFAPQVIEILNNKNYREKIIEGATKVANEYSVESFVSKIEIAYQSLITNQK